MKRQSIWAVFFAARVVSQLEPFFRFKNIALDKSRETFLCKR